MAKKATYVVKYRRRREQKTNYKKRLALLKSRKPRLIIRKTNKRVIGQIAEYNEKGDKILITVNSKELLNLGWKGENTKNITASYLTGYLLAKKALNNKIKEVVPDTGLHFIIKGCSIMAFIKGITDGGIKINYDPEIMPSEERIKGEHLKIKQDFEKIKKTIEEMKFGRKKK